MEMNCEAIINRQINEILSMMAIDDVIDEIKTIYYGNNQLRREAYKKTSLLSY